MLNEILQCWDGLMRKTIESNTRVTVLAATNLPQALDDAVLRRLPRRLHVPLPDADARMEILRKQLRHNALAADIDLASIAARTKDFSGSDLHSLAHAAAMHAVKRRLTAESTGKPADALATTSSHHPQSSAQASSSTVPLAQPQPPTTAGAKVVVICMDDFEHALRTLRPSHDGASESSRARALWESRYGEAARGQVRRAWGFDIPSGDARGSGV